MIVLTSSPVWALSNIKVTSELSIRTAEPGKRLISLNSPIPKKDFVSGPFSIISLFVCHMFQEISTEMCPFSQVICLMILRTKEKMFNLDPIQNPRLKNKKMFYLFVVASSFIMNLTTMNTTSAMMRKSIIAPTKSPTRNFTGPAITT
jgi:hypothetical protein